jgi:hypothetical protein
MYVMQHHWYYVIYICSNKGPRLEEARDELYLNKFESPLPKDPPLVTKFGFYLVQQFCRRLKYEKLTDGQRRDKCVIVFVYLLHKIRNYRCYLT